MEVMCVCTHIRTYLVCPSQAITLLAEAPEGRRGLQHLVNTVGGGRMRRSVPVCASLDSPQVT